MAENVGGRDMRTLLRRVGAAALLEFVDWETSLPPAFAPFTVAAGFGGGRGAGEGSVGVVNACTGVLASSSSSISRVVSYEEIDETSSLSTRSIFFEGTAGGGDGRSVDRTGKAGGASEASRGDGERLELRSAERRGLRSGEGWCMVGAIGAETEGMSGTDRSLGSRSIRNELVSADCE